MRARIELGLALLLTCFAVGCASSITGHRISKQAAAFIHPGITGRGEVVENLGPPLIELREPRVMAYSWALGRPIMVPDGPPQTAYVGWPQYIGSDAFIDTTPYREVGSVEKRRWVYCIALNNQGIVARSGRIKIKHASSLEAAVVTWARGQ